MMKLERKIDPTNLGQSALEVLRAPRLALPRPIDFKTMTKGLVTFAGFKSWKGMFSETESACEVWESEAGLTITPYSIKEKGSFMADLEREIVCGPTAEALGNALFRVFGIADNEANR